MYRVYPTAKLLHFRVEPQVKKKMDRTLRSGDNTSTHQCKKSVFSPSHSNLTFFCPLPPQSSHLRHPPSSTLNQRSIPTSFRPPPTPSSSPRPLPFSIPLSSKPTQSKSCICWTRRRNGQFICHES